MLNFDTVDTAGRTGTDLSARYQYRRYRHSGNLKVYEVTRVTWNGETDEWCIVLQEIRPDGEGRSDVSITRSFDSFVGNREDVPRFIAL